MTAIYFLFPFHFQAEGRRNIFASSKWLVFHPPFYLIDISRRSMKKLLDFLIVTCLSSYSIRKCTRLYVFDIKQHIPQLKIGEHATI